MKTILKKVTPLLLMAGLLLLVHGSYAQTQKVIKNTPPPAASEPGSFTPPPPPPPPPPDGPHHFDTDDEGMPRCLNLPDLTDDQQMKIRKLDLKTLEATTPLKNQMREKRARLATLLTTQPLNQKEAETVADDMGKLQASLLKLKIRHDQELRALLTPDQQVLFDARPKPFLRPERGMKKGR